MNSKQNPLGEIISIHKSGLFKYTALLALSSILLFIACLLAFVNDGSLYDPDRLTVFVIFLFLAFWPAFIAWYYSCCEARLFENGFVYHTRRWEKTVLWSEVRYVYAFSVRVNTYGIASSPQHRFGIRTEVGTIVRFSPRLDKVDELGAILLSVADRRNLEVISGVPYRFGSPEPRATKLL
jgi:hypothetical protein